MPHPSKQHSDTDKSVVDCGAGPSNCFSAILKFQTAVKYDERTLDGDDLSRGIGPAVKTHSLMTFKNRISNQVQSVHLLLLVVL